ncbi:nitroreductase family protein [Isoptericola sp. S6320L]|uniref:Acg family FMN-binding oxidoreductase n=1 Tax=Isoptericola sp. S6320L TaxID=2926411 RepID=UPI001FF42AAD|nr:nitroreductase family protein [Isoptericola sp. S6320L]MCK0118639.1 nitroreductase family protein [Isoptericola sp. S6320L]
MEILDARIERILRAAGRAPSVHNTQPWQVSVRGNCITLRGDPSRQLRHSDPLGRELFISCGTFLLNARTASRRESLEPAVTVLPDPDDRWAVARIELHPGLEPEVDELELAVAITRRVTTRSPFDDQPLDADVLEVIQRAAHQEGAVLRLIQPSEPVRGRVMSLVRRAEALAAEDAVARTEEKAWTAVAPGRPDGIPQEMLGPWTFDDRAPVRRFLASAGNARFEQRSTMAVLLSAGDSPRDWIASGQALERLLLVATTYFVRASFAATVLENPTTRHDLRQVLSLDAHPQMLMRLGYGRSPRHTLRRSVDGSVAPRG